ncbi:hypothetical protein [Sedimenticola sp.]
MPGNFAIITIARLLDAAVTHHTNALADDFDGADKRREFIK